MPRLLIVRNIAELMRLKIESHPFERISNARDNRASAIVMNAVMTATVLSG